MRRTLPYLLCLVVGVLLAQALEALPQDRTPVALCPRADSILVHPTPWEAEHGRRPYTIIPKCETLQ